MSQPQVIVMRHAQANEKGQLTGDGLEQARLAAQEMIKRGYVPSRILYSPVQRAVKTAELMAEIFRAAGCQVTLVSDSRLALEEFKIPNVVSELTEEPTLIVTHGDDLERFVGYRTSHQTEKYWYAQNCEAFVLSPPDGFTWRDAMSRSDSKLTVVDRFKPELT